MKKVTFKLRNRVFWVSQSSGFETEKEGIIVRVIAAGSRPEKSGKTMKQPGMPRDHESYIVKVGEKLYWPRVSQLVKVPK